MSNVDHLAARVRLDDELFTGSKLYKGMDVTLTGVLVGVGQPLSSLPVQSSAVRLYFEDGRVRFAELFDRGVSKQVKVVVYDGVGRVFEITLLEDGQLVDTWRYVYHPKSGKRLEKLTVRPGARPHYRITYDEIGNKVNQGEI